MTHPALSLTVLAALAAVALAHPATAGALAPRFADPVAIDNTVAAFTGQAIGVPGGAALPVDRRLRLAPCAAPLALSWRANAHDTVVVQCPDVGGWRLYVAVAGAAHGDPAAAAVMKGEAVTVAATGDGFSVSQSGEALEGGAVGSWIRVRTTAKGDPVRARIVRPGLVEFPAD
ncbi:flagella basal body P-ring formation protein FlgA [Novosphingobium sp.]|uniref:flagella basal body P-ring formation protein FlgA n=1 Tax=Novosphingobium sp. TaxID=1874826 RepID=UPI0038B75416